MNVIASFSYDISLELVIKELQQNGIHEDDIFVTPIDETRGGMNINLFECTAAMATAFSVLGVIYGFIWPGGPVVWGIIGFFIGVTVGFIIDIFLEKRKIGKGEKTTLIVQCSFENVQIVRSILFDHSTLGVSVVDFT